MNTNRHIYNPADNTFDLDTPKLRREIFAWHHQWTGQSEFDYDPEPFALHQVEDIRDYMGEDELSDTDKAFPYLVKWEEAHKDNASDWRIEEIARFAEENAAQKYADHLNTTNETAWISNDSNFSTFDLPEGITIDLSPPRHGNYPTSRYIEYEITFDQPIGQDQDGEDINTIAGTHHYRVQGFSDHNIPEHTLTQAIAAEIATDSQS